MNPIVNSVIISLSDDDDDDCSSMEDFNMDLSSTSTESDILELMPSDDDSDIEKKMEFMNELQKIDSIMMEEMRIIDTQYSISSPCEIKKLQVYKEEQISNIINYFTSKFNFSNVHNQFKKRSAPNAIVPYPTFLDYINFNNIRWLTMPSILFSQPMLEKLNTISIPWIYNDEKTEQQQAKLKWIEDFNEKHMTTSCIDDCFRKFICLEICHLKCGIYDSNKQEISGIVGISAALVQNENGKLKVLDMANIKIGCNARNYAYGDFGKMLLQTENYDALFIYCAEYGSVISTFMSNLFPWSPFILNARSKGKIINLVKSFSFNIIQNELDLCIDAKSHSKSCSMCNLNMFLLNIGSSKYSCTKRELKFIETSGSIQDRLSTAQNKPTSNHISRTIRALYNNPRNMNNNNRPIYLQQDGFNMYTVNIRKCRGIRYIETTNQPLLFTYTEPEKRHNKIRINIRKFICTCDQEDTIHSDCEETLNNKTFSPIKIPKQVYCKRLKTTKKPYKICNYKISN